MIGIGTTVVLIFSIESVSIQGSVSLILTQRLLIRPKLNPTQWISFGTVITRTRQLWLAVGNAIHVHSFDTGLSVDILNEVMERVITCISNHDAYKYVLVGSVSGLLKVVNLVNASTHTFFLHTPIVAIAVFPTGPLFVACGADRMLRMFDLKYFREMSCVRLGETPMGMGLMGERGMYIRTRSTIEIWRT